MKNITFTFDEHLINEEVFSLADQQNIKSGNGIDWKREDLYDH